MTVPGGSTGRGPSGPAASAPARLRFEGRTLVVFIGLVVAAVAFGILAVLVRSRTSALLRLDRSVADELHEFALDHPAFTQAMRVLSDIGTTTAWIVIAVPVIGWLLYRRLPRLALFVLVTGAGSVLLNNVIKVLVDRARPLLPDPVVVAGGKSFPSGHSQAAMVGYGILVVVFAPVLSRWLRRWLTAVAGLLVLGIGFSRIALGAHFLSDVIGAYLIGLAWLFGMIAAFRAWRVEQGDPAGSLTEGLEPEQGDRLRP